MATTLGTVVRRGTTSPSSTTSRLTSGFVRSPVSARNPLRQACPSLGGGKATCFKRNWLRTDYNVIWFGLIGWLAPFSIPAINCESLTVLFFESIGAELAHFPTPPPLASQFCGGMRHELVVADYVAPGAVPLPHFWANWIQGKD